MPIANSPAAPAFGGMELPVGDARAVRARARVEEIMVGAGKAHAGKLLSKAVDVDNDSQHLDGRPDPVVVGVAVRRRDLVTHRAEIPLDEASVLEDLLQGPGRDPADLRPPPAPLPP